MSSVKTSSCEIRLNLPFRAVICMEFLFLLFFIGISLKTCSYRFKSVLGFCTTIHIFWDACLECCLLFPPTFQIFPVPQNPAEMSIKPFGNQPSPRVFSLSSLSRLKYYFVFNSFVGQIICCFLRLVFYVFELLVTSSIIDYDFLENRNPWNLNESREDCFK